MLSLDGMNAVFVFTFHDGSNRTYKYDKGLQTFISVPNSAQDAHGNVIPEAKPSNVQVYLFTTGPGIQGATYDQTNIQFIFGDSGGGTGAGSCSFDGVTLHCHNQN